MQKKINLLATLLVIAIVLGGLSSIIDPAVREGWKAGSEMAQQDWKEDNRTAYEKGFEAGKSLRGALSLHPVAVRLYPKEILAYPDSLRNAKTDEMTPVSFRSVSFGMKEVTGSANWLEVLISICSLASVIAFILMLFVFVSSIKNGGVFLKGNEKILRWMAVLSFFWYAADWILTLKAFSLAKANVALEHYNVVFDAPNFFPLVLGFTLLLFAQIFAKGRKMEEDQEFMV